MGHSIDSGDPTAINNNKELEQGKACSRGNKDNEEMVPNICKKHHI